MSQATRSSFLEEEVMLLVQHFGVEKVRTALSKASNGTDSPHEPRPRAASAERDATAKPSVTSLLDDLRKRDEGKHGLLVEFYARLKDKRVLPESQDIRHFILRIGLKEIRGKSRKEMIPGLMRLLVDRPIERLQMDVAAAANISEQQRQQGFSVITNHLMGEKKGTESQEVSRIESSN